MIVFVDVELVSPVMMGGANPPGRGHEVPDQRWAFDQPALLRPPSIKGALRFWTRALAGDRDPWEVERELWGSLVSGQGAAVLPSQVLGSPTVRMLIPGRGIRSPMIAEGPRLRLRWRLRDLGQRERLAAVVWVWLHLGTLGRRARRGYGSLLWCPAESDLLDGFPRFDRGKALAMREALEGYLRSGLAEVQVRLGTPATAEGAGAVRRRVADWFRLETVDQVFVGNLQSARYDGSATGMEDRLHGLGGRSAWGEDRELGTGGQNRLASPMIWRVFPHSGGTGYWPVMTWSPVAVEKLNPGGNVSGKVESSLGFDRSLAGFAPSA